MTPEEAADFVDQVKKLQWSNSRLIELIEEYQSVFLTTENKQLDKNKSNYHEKNLLTDHPDDPDLPGHAS